MSTIPGHGKHNNRLYDLNVKTAKLWEALSWKIQHNKTQTMITSYRASLLILDFLKAFTIILSRVRFSLD